MLRLAEPARDNLALCELARLCPQGQRLRFYHHRTDYWERVRLQPDAVIHVVEEEGEIVAAVSVARKAIVIGGARVPVAYIHDLMVRPDRRGRGFGRALLRVGSRSSRGARLLYCCILEDNEASRRLFEGEGFTPYPRPLLYHVLLPALVRQRPPTDFRILPASDTEAETIHRWVRARRDFVDATSGHDGLFVLQRGRSRAWAALRRQDAQVFVDLPWYLALAGHILPGLPRTGKPVHAWTLHHVGRLGAAGWGLLRRLLGGVAWQATQAGVDAVVVPLFNNDPMSIDVSRVALTGWGVPPGATRLYVAGELAEQVLTASRPLVLNGQDA